MEFDDDSFFTWAEIIAMFDGQVTIPYGVSVYFCCDSDFTEVFKLTCGIAGADLIVDCANQTQSKCCTI